MKPFRDIDELVRAYRLSVSQWGEASDTPLANKLFDRTADLGAALRGLPNGQQLLLELLEDQNEVVRLRAGIELLWWDDPHAISVLESIQYSPGTSLYAIDAKYTLRTYRAGKLNWRAIPENPLVAKDTTPLDCLSPSAALDVHSLIMSGGVEHALDSAAERFSTAIEEFREAGRNDAADILAESVASDTSTAEDNLQSLTARYCALDDPQASLEARITEVRR